jgi:formylglycine-generating enzyme required for sulfatase activity
VAQYRVFIEDGGYTQRDYWTPEGWQWIQVRNRTQQWGADDARFANPNQAVIGVTWYECMAFCAWLTAQLADALSAGYTVRLATEAQWESAAAYDAQMQRHTYPWGEEAPTTEHAIFKDDQSNSLGAPAPVGVCLAGAAACGALDMSGNVWEWYQSSYTAYPQGAAGNQNDFTPRDGDVALRGGSWSQKQTGIRCVTRLRGAPYGIGNLGDGFRVLLSHRGSV